MLPVPFCYWCGVYPMTCTACCRSPVSIFPRAASYPSPHRHKTPREKLLEREVYGLRMQLSAIEASAGRGKPLSLERSYRLRQLLLHLLIGFEWNKDISFYLISSKLNRASFLRIIRYVLRRLMSLASSTHAPRRMLTSKALSTTYLAIDLPG